ncbi:MAG: hypothetical protein ACKEQI_00020 [Candidatus Hodgkinia cicadicola]
MITDFNPVTNDINLELSEAREIRTILVERKVVLFWESVFELANEV